MTVTIAIANTTQRCNPLAFFRTVQDKKLLQLFQQGYELHLWRGTTPWNLFLRKPGTHGSNDVMVRGKDMREATKAADRISVNRSDFLRIGRPLPHPNEGVITMALSSWELGLPFREVHGYDEAQLRHAEQEWAEVEADLERQRQRVYSAEPVDLGQLSPEALGLMKTLRPGPHGVTNLYPYPELKVWLDELAQRGIVELASNGEQVWYQLREPYRTGKLPRVQKVTLKFPPTRWGRG